MHLQIGTGQLVVINNFIYNKFFRNLIVLLFQILDQQKQILPYFVHKSFPPQSPRGTVTLCRGNSWRMMVGRLQHSALSAVALWHKLSRMYFWRGSVSAMQLLVSEMRSHKGTVLDLATICSPAGLMLNTVLSGTGTYFRRKAGGEKDKKR